MGKAWIGYSVSLSNVGQIIANDQGRRGALTIRLPVFWS